MYQPKIHDDVITRLYRLAKARNIPMTRLVNELLTDALNQREEQAAEGQGAYRKRRTREGAPR